MSAVWEPACVCYDAALAVRGVSTPGVSDIGDHSPQYESIVGVVVLGGVLDDNG